MKFQYSPGLLGYGPKGTNGTDGLSGMAFYFTDYEPELNIISVQSAIINNEVLWAKAEPGTKLPGNRVYNNGDIFVSSRGYIYKITNATLGEFVNTDKVLSKVVYFDTNKQIVEEGFERWFNIHSPAAPNRYLIDNNRSSNDNYLFPSQVYGVDLKDYTRIEYSDTSTFTLYSTAENANADEHKALALIITSGGNFRLGNVDGINRNTNLILDVSLLKANRDNAFSNNTPSQTVLTNAEKNTNLLFDPEFNFAPPGFAIFDSGADSITMFWNLSDFSSDPSIKGDLYFFRDVSTTRNYNLRDVSYGTPMIFHDVDESGSLTVEGLSLGENCKYRMSISKDGWERTSDVMPATVGSTPYYITVLDPSPLPMLTADYLGKFYKNNLYTYPICISTYTSPTSNWVATPNNSWVSVLPPTANGSTGTYCPAFDVSLVRNTEYLARSGSVTIKGTASLPTASVFISQDRRPARACTVKMVSTVSTDYDARARVVFDPSIQVGQNVLLTGQLKVTARARGGSHSARTNTQITLYKNSVRVTEASAFASSNSGSVCVSDYEDFIVWVTAGDVLEVRQGPLFDCVYWTSGTNGWEEGAGWMRLDSALDGYDVFTVDANKRYWNVERISCDGCADYCDFDSWVASTPTTAPVC